MTRLLISVRTPDEALLAARHGADFIDLKEPGAGALGGLPDATLRAIVQALRAEGVRLPVSATIGDLPNAGLGPIQQRVLAVAACGVDWVKVGIERGPQALPVLHWLAGCGVPVVPVFLADLGFDDAAVALAADAGFPGVMADTADKAAGSLFTLMAEEVLRHFVARVRQGGALAGLAGALRLPDLPRLAALAPDFAGFRSAVCAGARSDALDPQRVSALAQALLRTPVPA